MNRLQHFILGAAVALGAQSVSATDAPAALTERLKTLFPDQEVHSIEETPVAGLYETILGSELFYFSGDGNYLIHGSLFDLQNGVMNLTEERRNGLRKDAIAAVGEDSMIVFGPQDAKHTITVFTDIDCGYCRKLHSEMAQYGEEGIRVRYLSYPRSGPGTASFAKAISVWCADDREAAMTRAKAGDEVEGRECENPVLAHFELGREVGVSGTPALVLDSGQLVPGYVPAKRLKLMLDQAAEGAGS